MGVVGEAHLSAKQNSRTILIHPFSPYIIFQKASFYLGKKNDLFVLSELCW